jgi:hypothetical protein
MSGEVTDLVLSKRSMHDELWNSSEYLIDPGGSLELAAHVVPAAAVGGASVRALPAESGAV